MPEKPRSAIIAEDFARAGELRREQQELEVKKEKLERRYARDSRKKERIVDENEIAAVVSEMDERSRPSVCLNGKGETAPSGECPA